MEEKDNILDESTVEETVEVTPEAAEVNETPTADDATMTAEEFDALNSVESPAAPVGKKKMSKKKITWISITAVLAVIVIALGGVLIWLFAGGGGKTGVDVTNLEVFMDGKYYVGTVGEADLNSSFPDSTFAITGGVATLNAGKLTVTGTEAFKLTVTKGGKNTTLDVTVVDGATNVSTYADFYEAYNTKYDANETTKTFTITKQGKDVVIHNTLMAAEKALGTINANSDLYGNGCKLDAYLLAKSTFKNGKWPGGSTVIHVISEEKITIRDLHISGRDMKDGEELAELNGYGELIYVSNPDYTDYKPQVDIIHCIVENGHKTIHIINGIVKLEGTIIRNASDTTVSIGTFLNKKSTVTIKNTVIANSLASAVLMYNYDNNITPAETSGNKGKEKTWNTVNLEGFVDVYNWKLTNAIKFVPDTEITKEIGAVVNKIASTEIDNIKKHTEMKVIYGKGKAAQQYIHFGLMKIATNKHGENGSEYVGQKALNFKEEKLPMPGIATLFIKQVIVTGYFTNDKAAVKPKDTLATNKNMYQELLYGRKDK